MRFRIAEEQASLLMTLSPRLSVADEHRHYEVTLITGVTVEKSRHSAALAPPSAYPPGTVYTITVPAGSAPVSMPDVHI